MAKSDRNDDDRSETSDYSSEDERAEDYKRGSYHAVQIGDTYKHGRYVVQGHFYTVWLAWDTHQSIKEFHGRDGFEVGNTDKIFESTSKDQSTWRTL